MEEKNYIPFSTLKDIEAMITKTIALLNGNLESQEKEIGNLPKDDTEIAAKCYHAICEKIKYYQGYQNACKALLSYLGSTTTYTH
jgi:hypothetical protein